MIDDERHDWFGRIFEHAHKQHDQMDAEFMRLATEPCGKVPVVGDRVLVASGLLNMGHLWIREEAEVLECGDTSYRVRFTDYISPTVPGSRLAWVHGALITDVLGPACETNT